MTNPESDYPFLRWPIGSSSNLIDICQHNRDDNQLFHPPMESVLLTYLQQQKNQSASTYSTYVLQFILTFMISLYFTEKSVFKVTYVGAGSVQKLVLEFKLLF
jgi:hypothetical protein